MQTGWIGCGHSASLPTATARIDRQRHQTVRPVFVDMRIGSHDMLSKVERLCSLSDQQSKRVDFAAVGSAVDADNKPSLAGSCAGIAASGVTQPVRRVGIVSVEPPVLEPHENHLKCVEHQACMAVDCAYHVARPGHNGRFQRDVFTKTLPFDVGIAGLVDGLDGPNLGAAEGVNVPDADTNHHSAPERCHEIGRAGCRWAPALRSAIEPHRSPQSRLRPASRDPAPSHPVEPRGSVRAMQSLPDAEPGCEPGRAERTWAVTRGAIERVPQSVSASGLGCAAWVVGGVFGAAGGSRRRAHVEGGPRSPGRRRRRRSGCCDNQRMPADFGLSDLGG